MLQMVLASASPRRAQLLAQAGYKFSVVPSNVSENIEKNLNPEQALIALAEQKAQAVGRDLLLRGADSTSFKISHDQDIDLTQPFVVVGADTEVLVDGKFLGKPQSKEQAIEFLNLLSGRQHEVLTAVAALDLEINQIRSGVERTKISFKKLSTEEIETYVSSGEAFDKAGGYGIQGAASAFIASREGSWDNVVGMPMSLFEELIVQIRYLRLKREIGSNKVRLIGVSKLQSISRVRGALKEGLTELGENYVQEALKKKELLNLNFPDLNWHFIGRIQSKKIKQLVGEFSLIHGVDRFEILESINQIAEQKRHKQKILLQLNLADENSKAGMREEELGEILPRVQLLKWVEVLGFMSLPPEVSDPEENRGHFKRMRNLLLHWQKQFPSLTELSMGTSQDFKVAISEGASMVRVGSTLFGDRTPRDQKEIS